MKSPLRLGAAFAPLALVLACGGAPPAPPASPVVEPAVSAPAAPSPVSAVDMPAAPGAPLVPDALLPPPSSRKATKKIDPAWAACHATFKPASKEPAAAVTQAAHECSRVTKMKPVTKMWLGFQGAENPHQEITFKAQAGHCYRAYAYAETTIKDLDVLIKDSAGDIVAEDSTDDSSPVVLEDGAVCFTVADEATLIVSVGDGKGRFAAQVHGD